MGLLIAGWWLRPASTGATVVDQYGWMGSTGPRVLACSRHRCFGSCVLPPPLTKTATCTRCRFIRPVRCGARWWLQRLALWLVDGRHSSHNAPAARLLYLLSAKRAGGRLQLHPPRFRPVPPCRMFIFPASVHVYSVSHGTLNQGWSRGPCVSRHSTLLRLLPSLWWLLWRCWWYICGAELEMDTLLVTQSSPEHSQLWCLPLCTRAERLICASVIQNMVVRINDLYCVGWGVKVYSLTSHEKRIRHNWEKSSSRIQSCALTEVVQLPTEDKRRWDWRFAWFWSFVILCSCPFISDHDTYAAADCYT